MFMLDDVAAVLGIRLFQPEAEETDAARVSRNEAMLAAYNRLLETGDGQHEEEAPSLRLATVSDE